MAFRPVPVSNAVPLKSKLDVNDIYELDRITTLSELALLSEVCNIERMIKNGLATMSDDFYNIDSLACVLPKKFQLLAELGSGTYGCVIKAFDKDKNEEVALKISKFDRDFWHQNKHEISLLRKISDKMLTTEQCVVRFYEQFYVRFNTFGSSMELMQETLHDQVAKDIPFNEIQCKKVLKDILSGLEFLHNIGIVHADLKPENIGYSKNGVYKNYTMRGHSDEEIVGHIVRLRFQNRGTNYHSIVIFDFGISFQTNSGEGTRVLQSQPFRAPEVSVGTRIYTEKIDIWSVGIIAVLLAALRYPFADFDEYTQMQKIVEYFGFPPRSVLKESAFWSNFFTYVQGSIRMKFASQRYRPNSKSIMNLIPNEYDLDFYDFVVNCLRMDPVERKSAMAMLHDEWLCKNQ